MPGHDDVFFQVPRTAVSTSEGAVALPIMYYDASALYAFFLVDRGAAESLLGGDRLRPALTAGDRALAAIACYQYRDTSVGVYNEVGLALSVTADDAAPPFGGWPDMVVTRSSPEARTVGMHVLDLPVTTAAANAAGREIWGFPKFVTPITYAKEGRRFDCEVASPDGGSAPLMRLAGTLMPSLPAAPLSLALYSELDGQLLRCVVNARGRSWMTAGRGLRLTAPGGEHRMAGHLAALGLDGATPAGVIWTDNFQSRLNAGVDVPATATSRQAAAASTASAA
ncbi:MAG: acetoacetate decarboxylase family protein [Baekduia sp.]